MVNSDGTRCWTCNWNKFCLGCPIDGTEDTADCNVFYGINPALFVIDWRAEVLLEKYFDPFDPV